jgi:Zn-dependent protease with chaperone function
MSIDTAPLEAEHLAAFLDGRTSRKHNVTLRFANGLDIVEGGAVIDNWPYDQVRRADGPPQIMRLRCASALPLARLEVIDRAAQEAIAARCGSLDVGAPSAGQTWRIVFWSLAATASIVLLAFFGIPLAADQLAPMLPFSLEQRIGGAVDKQAQFMFGGKTCTGADGQAAFNKLVDKLKVAGGIEIPLEARVVSSKIPNAFALPGGKVYLLEGLLKKAEKPDEIAGVLAHELGHVQHRDSLRKIIQTGGTSFLIGLLFGDVTGGSAVLFVGRSLFDASYSREQERAADDFAIDVMHKLKRSPKPLGEILVRVTGSEGKNSSLTLLSSHPLSEDRLALMSKDAGPTGGQELLSAAEWKALKNICGSGGNSNNSGSARGKVESGATIHKM